MKQATVDAERYSHHAATRALDYIVWDWGVRCFGAEHMHNRKVRALRMIEEAIEAGQSIGLARDDIHTLVDRVYERERGEIEQELGGVFVTLMVLCITLDVDPEMIYLKEVRRCLSKDPEHFAARNREKMTVNDEEKV